ncbi:hypothetical protein PV325_008056 [Microctonus aethiopoides]|uniref:Cilia- and flagella-associated protein 45 n=1 Tax=Microctonus aethiopoides TaxID=144406 RepID=A0AA39F1N0_9HYME|nr:hypothetical protein PV325_008056 [Microctonus aethiopoides]KAK0160918.1 hypothetical protein PV328_008274 [Microctonus aethiopoides]
MLIGILYLFLHGNGDDDDDKTMMKQTIFHPTPKIISRMEYENFRKSAQEGLMLDKIKRISCDNITNGKDDLFTQSKARKDKIHEIDRKKIQEKSLKLNKLDDEAKAQATYLLERANDLKIEQEEEILLCNKLILESKCRAIRDLQVAEKKIIKEELKKEDKRLNEMMENKEKIIIEEEKREAAKSAEKQRTFARLLQNQIMENEEQRIIEFERKQEEAKLTNLDNIAWQEAEIHKANKIKQNNELMRKQMLLENMWLIKAKEIEREEEKILDMRIRKFQKEKEERDRNIAEARRIINAKKDAERAKVAARTLQTFNLQEQIEELNIARVREEVEREWRNREKMEALKKLDERRKFAEAREQQIQCRKILQSMEMEREKREFDRILKIQKEAMHKEEQMREKRNREAEEYRNQVLKQMDEKSREKIEKRNKKIEEGLAINIQMQMRTKKLKDAIERKCNEMRDNKVPEIYINNVKMLIDKIK